VSSAGDPRELVQAVLAYVEREARAGQELMASMRAWLDRHQTPPAMTVTVEEDRE